MSSIIDMLHESCLKYPQKTALRCKTAGLWVDFSYETIWDASNRVAAGLAEWGIKQGERVAILGPSSPVWVIVYLGILKSNAIAVPVDKDLKQGELRHILTDCDARIVFTEDGFTETIDDIADSLPKLEKIVLMNHVPPMGKLLSAQAERALAALVNEWQRLAGKYHVHENDMKRIEILAKNFHELVLPADVKDNREQNFFQRLLHTRDQAEPDQAFESLASFEKQSVPPELTAQPHDPAVILYTSGTTGRSKGAMLSHANITSNVRTAVELFDLDPEMHTLSFLPINHVFEQVAGIILPLAVGGTVSFAESLRKLGDNLGEVKPNFLLGVPAVFRLLAERMSRRIESQQLTRLLYTFAPTRPLVTKKIREAFGGDPVFISGGAALDPIIAAKLKSLGLNIYQGYGITETSPVIAVETPAFNRLGTVGRPMPGIEVMIHDPNEDGVGEIWVKGPNIMLGYFNNKEATDEVITDGWYHTGDLGCVDDDGALRLCGRAKNLIVTANGKNVYPEEVENEMLNSNFIEEIMVYGHKVDATTEEVYAIIYPNQDALDAYAAEKHTESLSLQDVEEIIRREVLDRGKALADYKRIRRFTLREDEFPKTTTRKIKRFVVEADINTGESATGD